MPFINEFGSERKHLRELPDKKAFTGLYSSLRIEDSWRQAAGELQFKAIFIRVEL
jgi:hypothetical protein